MQVHESVLFSTKDSHESRLTIHKTNFASLIQSHSTIPRNDLNFPLQIIFASANSAILDVFRLYYLAKIEFFKAELKTCSLFVALTPKAHARHVRFQDTLRSLKSECRHLERKHASKWSSSRALPLPGPPPFDTCTVHPPRSLGTVLG